MFQMVIKMTKSITLILRNEFSSESLELFLNVIAITINAFGRFNISNKCL